MQGEVVNGLENNVKVITIKEDFTIENSPSRLKLSLSDKKDYVIMEIREGKEAKTFSLSLSEVNLMEDWINGLS